jgi:hypothetical protein
MPGSGGENGSMSMTKRCALWSILLLAACNQRSHWERKAASCKISNKDWHYGKIVPVPLVIGWHVSMDSVLKLNGRPMSFTYLLKDISRTKALRPSPYLILTSDGQNCHQLNIIADQIDREFNCRQNFCYYALSQVTHN